MTLILTDSLVGTPLVPIRTSEVMAIGEGTGGGTVRSTDGGAAVAVGRLETATPKNLSSPL